MNGSSGDVTVGAGAASQLIVAASPTSLSAGQATSVTVTAEDAFGNVATTFNDSVSLTDSAGNATFGSVSFSGGLATVSATLDKSGRQTIAAADASAGSTVAGATSNSIAVTAATG